jgi:magnesium chelatase family protein
MCLSGARADSVELELQHTGGLMQRIILTGLPGGAVRESRDRIRGCLEQLGLPVPRRSVLVNLAPADLPKRGNGFDLPLALGLLALSGVVSPQALAERVVVGELALDGRLRPVRGALTLALHAVHTGARRLMLPRRNGGEAALVEGLEVEAVSNLSEAVAVLSGARARAPVLEPRAPRPVLDLADMRGQGAARRALEIAATGEHNLLLCGSPGCGKTMLASRLPGLLPALDHEQLLEVSALHGLAAGGASSIVTHPPFRAPHHTLSRAGLIGGGNPLVPGEISLAHRGVLFLDELAEYPRALLESLRQPLEEGCVQLSRAGRVASFPARVQLVGAMNPCPCGYLGHVRRACRCTPLDVARYRRRLSGPLLDRFDLALDLDPPDAEQLLDQRPGEASAVVAARVAAARRLLAERVAEAPSAGVRNRIALAVDQLSLSGRAMHRSLDVAASIAALDERVTLAEDDLDEALSLRLTLVRFHDAVPP